MADQILVEYKVSVDGLKADLKTVQTEMKATEKAGTDAAQNTTNAFAKTETATKSLKTQLRELKVQLANATDPKEIQRLAQAAGTLSDRIGDASDAARAFANESKASTAKNLFSQISADVMSLDFKGAADKAAILSAVLKSMSFADIVGGIKSFGAAILALGEAMLLNPFGLILAGIAAIGIGLKMMTDATRENAQKQVDAIKTIENQYTKVYDRQILIQKALGKSTEDLELKKMQLSEKSAAFQVRVLEKLQNSHIGLNDDQKKQLVELYDLQLGLQAQIAAKTLEGYTKQSEESKKSLEKSKALLEKYAADKKARDEKATEEAIAEAKRLQDLKTQLEINLIASDFEKKKAIINNNFDKQIEDEKGNSEIIILLTKNRNKELNDLEQERENKNRKIREEAQKDWIKIFKDGAKDIDGADTELNTKLLAKTIKTNDQIIEEEKKKQAEIKQIQQATFQFIGEMVSTINQIQQNRFETEIQGVNNVHDEEVSKLDDQLKRKEITQKEYDKRKKQSDEKARAEEKAIKTKAWESAKQASIISTIISTASAVVAQLANPTPYVGFILAALAAATGAAQIAVIESQPTPKFAKGVVGLKGKGTGTSDEIHAMLSAGESVVIAEESRKYSGLLEAMNKKQTSKFITDFYIAPALKAQKKKFDEEKEKSFASNLMASLALNNKFYDGNLLDSLKQSRKNDKEIAIFLAKELKSNQRSPNKW